MPKPRHAFTLIELLIVVVVIGVIAAVAFPRFWTTRRQAQVASIKWELRNVVPRAEAYYADNGTYAGLVVASQTPGVTLQLLEAGLISYRLQGTHEAAPDALCTLEGGALADGGAGGGTGPAPDGGPRPGLAPPTFGATPTTGGVFGAGCK